MDNHFNIYEDLDDIQKEEEQRSEKLKDLEAKYNDALRVIKGRDADYKILKDNFDKLSASFKKLLETAKAELRRKDKLIEQLRKENEDICFRRRLPKLFDVPPSNDGYVPAAESVIDVPSEKTLKNPFRGNEVHSHTNQSYKIERTQFLKEQETNSYLRRREHTKGDKVEIINKWTAKNDLPLDDLCHSILKRKRLNSFNVSSGNEQETENKSTRCVEKESSRKYDLKAGAGGKFEQRIKKDNEYYERKEANSSRNINENKRFGKGHINKTESSDIETRKATAEETKRDDIKNQVDVVENGDKKNVVLTIHKRDKPKPKTEKQLTESVNFLDRMKNSKEQIEEIDKKVDIKDASINATKSETDTVKPLEDVKERASQETVKKKGIAGYTYHKTTKIDFPAVIEIIDRVDDTDVDMSDEQECVKEDEQQYRLVIDTEATDNQEKNKIAEEGSVCKTELRNSVRKLQESEVRRVLKARRNQLDISLKEIVLATEITSKRNDNFKNDSDENIKEQTLMEESNGKYTKMEDRGLKKNVIDISDDENTLDEANSYELIESKVIADTGESHKRLGEQSALAIALGMRSEVLHNSIENETKPDVSKKESNRVKEKIFEKAASTVLTNETDNMKNKECYVSGKSAEIKVEKQAEELKFLKEKAFVTCGSTTQDTISSSVIQKITEIVILEDKSLSVMVELAKNEGQSQEESGTVSKQDEFEMNVKTCDIEHADLEKPVDTAANKERVEHKRDLIISPANKAMTENKFFELDAKECKDEEPIYMFTDEDTKYQDDIKATSEPEPIAIISFTEEKHTFAKKMFITDNDKAVQKKLIDKTINNKDFFDPKSNISDERSIALLQLREIENSSVESFKCQRGGRAEKALKSNSTTPSKNYLKKPTDQPKKTDKKPKQRKKYSLEDQLTTKRKKAKKQKTKEWKVSKADRKESDSQESLKISVMPKKCCSIEMDQNQRDPRALEKNDYQHMEKTNTMPNKLFYRDSKEESKKKESNTEKKENKHNNANDKEKAHSVDYIAQHCSEIIDLKQTLSSTAKKAKWKNHVKESVTKKGQRKKCEEIYSNCKHHVSKTRTENVELSSRKKVGNTRGSKFEVETIRHEDTKVTANKKYVEEQTLKESQPSVKICPNSYDRANEKTIEFTRTPHEDFPSKASVCQILDSNKNEGDIKFNLGRQKEVEEEDLHSTAKAALLADESALSAKPQSSSKGGLKRNLSISPTKTEDASEKECSPSKKPKRCTLDAVSSSTKTCSHIFSPSPTHAIFETDYEHSFTTLCSPDAKMQEVDANMRILFESPQTVLGDTLPPISNDESLLSTSATRNVNQNVLHDPTKDDTINIVIDEPQPTSILEYQSSQIYLDESAQSLKSKSYSMGGRDYRVQSNSINDINIFITRKRRKRSRK